MPLSRPVVAITLGDPASIGPEIVVRALAVGGLQDVCIPVVVGDREHVVVAARPCLRDHLRAEVDAGQRGRERAERRRREAGAAAEIECRRLPQPPRR